MFPSPILEEGSIGFPVYYWERVLFVPQSNAGQRFYEFTRPGKGSVGSQVQYWEKVL